MKRLRFYPSPGRMKLIPTTMILLTVAAMLPSGSGIQASEPAPATEIIVFEQDLIHFNLDNPRLEARETVEVLDNGRLVQTGVDLPRFEQPVRITAHLIVTPIPKDELSMHDNWDRAGSIRLMSPDGAPVEIVKFITAYGGRTEWSYDVSHLAPLLGGPVTIGAFIDTWVSPAWTIDFKLSYEPDESLPTYHWVEPLYLVDSYEYKVHADTGLTLTTAVPNGQQRVLLYYFVSGHCTDGRGADEFVKKDNVLSVDDVVVYRYRPWRDDCRRFRDINPYTRRWSDGYWSSDYSRSGWCPGDIVTPLILDLSDHLTPGNHELSFRIENVRPSDENGHHGYWRVSAFLVGQTDPVSE